MKRRPGLEIKQNSVESYILDNAHNIPIALDAAATTSGNQLPNHGDWGYFGTNVYINLGGSTYRFAVTLV